MSDYPDNTPLGNSISVLSGFPFPSAQFTEGIGKPLIRIRDLIGSQTETNFVGDFDPALLIRHDDVLIGMDGDFNVVRWKGPEALLNQRVCKVSSASDEIDERFLFWWLKPHIQIVHRRTPQTTVRHLSVGDVYRIPKPALVSKAQAFAAAVLDTVDEAIPKTEAVIAKLRQVRAGLLHDLLTRGLDHHGQLRDPIAHPEQFQPSPLGLIPKDWDVAPLENFISRIDQGWSPDCDSDTTPAGQWGVLKTTAVQWEGYNDAENKRLPAFLNPLPTYEVSNGDVLMTRCGPSARVGVVALVSNTQGRLMLSDKLYRLVPREGINPAFLVLMLSSHPVQSRLAAEKTGMAESQTNISHDIVRKLNVGIPSPEEQASVVAHMDTQDDLIRAENQELAKLLAVKSGLMTDLLTGRVRVPAHL